CAVFFLRRECLFGRPHRTDPLAKIDDLIAQFLKAVKCRHLLLCFAQRRRRSERLGDGLPADLAREPERGPVAGIVTLGAMTGGFTALARGGRNASAAE